MFQKITSSSNKTIKLVKSLHRKRNRWKEEKYFIEGVRAVEETLDKGKNIDFIIFSDGLCEVNGGEDLLTRMEKKGHTIYHTTDKILGEISDTQKPQGIICVLNMENRSLDSVLKKKDNFLILLDNLQDPGNLGTIIRTADAMGANGVVVTKGCVDIYNPKVIRSTMGSVFHVPIIMADSIDYVINVLRNNNITIIAAGLETTRFCYDEDFSKDFALIIGNEASGITDNVMKMCDSVVKIPMSGDAESLNAAIASAIIMYEANRQRTIKK
ncbi:23S rRNA (guanosine(2251)-2'-O)-methyltransferase RlmB [Dethiothermospora halolimnae]|uniref:23S rRNA (guanosine(2251)-2'-O)-methyltransferase RlmB n=1 Tax=Dethiothermospora halolimnae TaxID=3114390 RepID=UPI003CCBF93B